MDFRDDSFVTGKGASDSYEPEALAFLLLLDIYFPCVNAQVIFRTKAEIGIDQKNIFYSTPLLSVLVIYLAGIGSSR